MKAKVLKAMHACCDPSDARYAEPVYAQGCVYATDTYVLVEYEEDGFEWVRDHDKNFVAAPMAVVKGLKQGDDVAVSEAGFTCPPQTVPIRGEERGQFPVLSVTRMLRDIANSRLWEMETGFSVDTALVDKVLRVFKAAGIHPRIITTETGMFLEGYSTGRKGPNSRIRAVVAYRRR